MPKSSNELIQERLVEALRLRGCEEEATFSTRYRKFQHPDGVHYYWVGVKGDLRKGLTVTSSFSISRTIPRFIRGVHVAKVPQPCTL